MTDQFTEATINNMSLQERLHYGIPPNTAEVEELLDQVTELEKKISDKDDEISLLDIKILELETRLATILEIAQDD